MGREMDTIWSPEEAAAYLRVHPQTVYRRLQAGKMPGAKVGKVWRLRKSDVDDYLRGYWMPAPPAAAANEAMIVKLTEAVVQVQSELIRLSAAIAEK